jgi:hypothetical protein
MQVEQFYWASRHGAAPVKYSFAAVGLYNLTAGKMLETIYRWSKSSGAITMGIRYALDKESLCK